MRLSPREVETLGLVAKGLTTQEIATRLGISDVTVKWHVKNSMKKLNASSRAEAVAVAIRLGLIK